jgi:ketosteroid isomerase-like protein
MRVDYRPCVCIVALISAMGFSQTNLAADVAADESAQTSGTPGVATPEDEAVHNQLRAVRDAMMDAWKRRDIDGLLAHVDPNIVVTWQNGEVNRGPEAIRKFYDEMLSGKDSVLSNIVSTLKVDDLSILHGPDTAIAFGSIHDDITFKRPAAAAPFIGSGNTLSLDSRWTATLVRKAGEWKLASYHVSADLFSNPVTQLAIKAAGRIAGIIGFAIGAVLMLILGWALWGRTKRVTASP